MKTLLGGATVGLMGIGQLVLHPLLCNWRQLAVKVLQVWVTWHPTSFTTQTTCSVVLWSTAYNVCASGLPPASPSKTTCLLPSPAGGVDEEVVGILSHLKEFKHLRKVKMPRCENLSPSLIATICEGLCSSNSMEEVVVTSEVSVLFVCLTTPYKLLSSVSKLSLKTIYTCLAALNRRQPLLPLTRGSPHDALQLTVLFIQFFFAVCSSHLYSFVFFV